MHSFNVSETAQNNLFPAGILIDGGNDIVIAKRLGCFLGCGGSAKLVTDDNFQNILMRWMRYVFGIHANVIRGRREAEELAASINDHVGMVAEEDGEPEREDSPLHFGDEEEGIFASDSEEAPQHDGGSEP
ncbi:hypothetical protein N9L19_00680 [bacterium]|nr:hypothetical protein [bacterium]